MSNEMTKRELVETAIENGLASKSQAMKMNKKALLELVETATSPDPEIPAEEEVVEAEESAPRQAGPDLTHIDYDQPGLAPQAVKRTRQPSSDPVVLAFGDIRKKVQLDEKKIAAATSRPADGVDSEVEWAKQKGYAGLVLTLRGKEEKGRIHVIAVDSDGESLVGEVLGILREHGISAVATVDGNEDHAILEVQAG